MIALLVYLAAAVIYTWPLVIHPTSHLAAPVGPGDPFLNLWILGWGLQAYVRNPWDVVTGRVFDANIFHPADSTLAYSDHLLLQSAVLSPLYAVSGDVVLCYNMLFFASIVASGLAMHAFVRAVVGSNAAAYLAGLAWAFWPYRFAHLIHLQLQALYFVPLAFLFLHKLVAGRRKRDAVALGAMAGLQALSSVYYGVIGAIGLAIGAVTLAVAVGRWRSALIARRLLLAAFVGALIVAPVVWVYWKVQQDEGFGRNLFEASRGAASMTSYVRVPPENVVYGRTGLLSSGGSERALFPGIVVLGLACAGIMLGLRGDMRPLAVTMIAVGAFGFVLSFGPDGARDLYAAFQRYIFGFAAIRAPSRFAVLVMFALATLAAVGWRELTRRPAVRRVLHVAFALMMIEYLSIPAPLTPAPPRTSAVGQWLAREPGRGAVIYLPLGLDIESTPAMVQSLQHRRPIVTGYSGQRPNFYSALVDTLSTFPSDEAMLALNEFGVRFLVTSGAFTAPPPLVERARFDDGVIYEFRWTPEIRERLSRNVAVTPEPPGPPPFAAGETARYTAHWSGAAVALPAGEITVSVQQPAFTFLVRAETAPWVSRFFEARDVFMTRADAMLLPQLHERDQREGARHVTRAYVYNHADGLVRIGRTAEHAVSEDGVSLPLAPASRDSISALFYARTLPLSPGRRFLIPVNEAGRQVIVELLVADRERIRVQGKDVLTLRLEPRMRRGSEARRFARALIWVTDDDRRLPVALDLEAGFGRVRLELVSYTP
jgi:hypothetical protein